MTYRGHPHTMEEREIEEEYVNRISLKRYWVSMKRFAYGIKLQEVCSAHSVVKLEVEVKSKLKKVGQRSTCDCCVRQFPGIISQKQNLNDF